MLGATHDHHLGAFKNQTAENIRNNIYVDHVITGTEKVRGAVEFNKEAKETFAKASMNLHDRTSNSQQVLAEILVPMTDRHQGKTMKMFGLTWTKEDDKLSLKSSHLGAVSFLSKRTVLKQIASVYDPLGLFSPVNLRGKL